MMVSDSQNSMETDDELTQECEHLLMNRFAVDWQQQSYDSVVSLLTRLNLHKDALVQRQLA